MLSTWLTQEREALLGSESNALQPLLLSAWLTQEREARLVLFFLFVTREQ